MASIKSVLTDFFKQYHFNKMAPEVRARFDDYRNSGNKKDLTDDMHDWVRDHIDEVTGENKELVDIKTKLSDEKMLDLYNEMNAIVAEMYDDKKKSDSYYGTYVTKFLDKYYDEKGNDDRAFGPNKFSNKAENALKGFEDATRDIQLKSYINNFLTDDKNIELTYDELNEGIKNKRYEAEPEFRRKLIRFFERFDAPYGVDADEFYEIKGIIVGDKSQVNPFKINLFKEQLPDILKKLHDQIKLREFYEKHDNGVVLSAYNKAKEKVSYDDKDSKNFIHAKTEDELTVIQKIQKKVSDKFEDYFGKYVRLRGDPTFNKAEPLAIFKAMDKLKIKPTDGLGVIIDKAEEIKAKMEHKSISADDHLDWFVNEMKTIKEGMPKAFDTALENGWQLNAIAQQVIKDGVPAKIEQAKTTLELLAVMQYGHTNSKIMDAIKDDKDLFNLFSNPELSWNKGPGKEVIGIVTKATDKVIRFGALAVGYSVTAAINEIKKVGTRIRKEKGQLAKKHAGKTAENTESKDITEAKLAAIGKEKAALETKYKNRFYYTAYGDPNNPDPTIQREQKKLDDSTMFINKWVKDLDARAKDLSPEQQDEIAAFIESVHNVLNGEPGAKVPNIGAISDATARKLAKDIKDGLTDFEKVRAKKEDFEKAAAEISAAEKREAELQEDIDNWDDDHKDKYEDLKDYWNRLIGNRYSPRGLWNRFKPGSKENKQKAAIGWMERAA